MFLISVARAVALDEVDGCGRPVGEVEGEAGGEKTAGDDAPALEDEFGLGAEKECAESEEGGGGGCRWACPMLRAALP